MPGYDSWAKRFAIVAKTRVERDICRCRFPGLSASSHRSDSVSGGRMARCPRRNGDATGEATAKMRNQDNKQSNELHQGESNQPASSKMGPTTRPDVTRSETGALGASSGGK
jgi:hypothetical protein